MALRNPLRYYRLLAQNSKARSILRLDFLIASGGCTMLTIVVHENAMVGKAYKAKNRAKIVSLLKTAGATE